MLCCPELLVPPGTEARVRLRCRCCIPPARPTLALPSDRPFTSP